MLHHQLCQDLGDMAKIWRSVVIGSKAEKHHGQLSCDGMAWCDKDILAHDAQPVYYVLTSSYAKAIENNDQER